METFYVLLEGSGRLGSRGPDRALAGGQPGMEKESISNGRAPSKLTPGSQVQELEEALEDRALKPARDEQVLRLPDTVDRSCGKPVESGVSAGYGRGRPAAGA
ncbi:hypothetical protein HPB52_001703 [Rhipicephalus sanguineus]|uniref:Uncharacterized protein n=1 Tax=Rhipicephalus sanguineus TaxID=34632 RepID=A0A9D4PU24_RHISA|nr:hypothetical protein HPB52_001703 [Rhipicephalus sanguineus]